MEQAWLYLHRTYFDATLHDCRVFATGWQAGQEAARGGRDQTKAEALDDVRAAIAALNPGTLDGSLPDGPNQTVGVLTARAAPRQAGHPTAPRALVAVRALPRNVT